MAAASTLYSFTGAFRVWVKAPIGHFTVVSLVTWPLSGSEAGGDLALIQTLMLFTCKSCRAN